MNTKSPGEEVINLAAYCNTRLFYNSKLQNLYVNNSLFTGGEVFHSAENQFKEKTQGKHIS